MTRKQLYILCVLLLSYFGIYAMTQVNLSRDATGLLPVANAGTNTATASAGTVLVGPASGAAAAYSFRAPAPAETGKIYRPNTQRFSYIVVADATTVTYTGSPLLAAGSCGTIFAADSDDPIHCRNEDSTYVGTLGLVNAGAGHNPDLQTFSKLSQSASNRMYIGLFSTNGTGVACGFFYLGDAPDCGTATFRYCNDVGITCAADLTTWKCYTKDAVGGTSHEVDSGVTVDANWHDFRIYENGAAYDFYIDDMINPVCHMTSDLPDSTHFIEPVFWITPLDATVPTYGWAWINFNFVW